MLNFDSPIWVGNVMTGWIKFVFPLLWFMPHSALSLEFQKETLDFQLENGRTIQAQIRLPRKEFIQAPLPALFLFGGFKKAAHVLELVHPPKPLLLGSFDYPFDPPRKFHFPASLKFAPEAKQAAYDTLSAIPVFRRKVLERYPVDAGKFTIIGASVGAPIAIYAAWIDSGLSGLAIVHGFGKIPMTIQHQFMKSWKRRYRYGYLLWPVAFLLSRFAWYYLWIPPPESVLGELRSHQKVISIAAEEDSFIPKEARAAIVESLEKTSLDYSLVNMPGDHLQPGSDELIEEISARVMDWMKEKGLL